MIFSFEYYKSTLLVSPLILLVITLFFAISFIWNLRKIKGYKAIIGIEIRFWVYF